MCGKGLQDDLEALIYRSTFGAYNEGAVCKGLKPASSWA